MPMTFNADLFRIAHMGVSTEETRFYLCGVYVHPDKHGQGARMVSTDGHKLLCLWDKQASGVPDKGIILQASKPALAQMKRGKGADRRMATVTLEERAPLLSADLHDWKVGSANGTTVDIADRCGAVMLGQVDGSFPDYSRVIPRGEKCGDKPACFNAAYVALMCEVGAQLAKLDGRREAHMSMCAADPASPALVRWGCEPDALGVVMPLRGDGVHGVPYWL